MTTPLLRVSGLSKTYGNGPVPIQVLRNVTLQMNAGERLAIMGPSGSGKSTLLHVVGTLDHPTSGTLEISGKNPFAFPEKELARFRNEVIGFIFQDHHLLPQYSVLENVLLPVLAFQSETEEAAKRASDLLQRVGLGERIHHRPAELSGGERQRAAVARALINNPQILLCDEPTGSLDRATAGNVAALLLEMHRDAKTALIVVTHSMELAEHFEKRFELNEGQLVQAE